MNTFFTSDTHLDHHNIIKYSNRPFSSTEEMNETLIENWNKTVSVNDIVYHLGDFSFCNDHNRNREFFNRLKGKKYLIIGNHDPQATTSMLWEKIHSYKELNVNKKRIVLFHYPIESWNGKFRKAIHLHGHVHTTPNFKEIPKIKNRYDVGVDNNNFTPISLDEIFLKLND